MINFYCLATNGPNSATKSSQTLSLSLVNLHHYIFATDSGAGIGLLYLDCAQSCGKGLHKIQGM